MSKHFLVLKTGRTACKRVSLVSPPLSEPDYEITLDMDEIAGPDGCLDCQKQVEAIKRTAS